MDATVIIGFADRLAEALHALDRRSPADQPFRDAEALEVAPEAYQRATGTEWDHVEPVSYESASNDVGWA
jgi:hypothetical protein